MTNSTSSPIIKLAKPQPQLDHAKFGRDRRLDKTGFAQILTPSKEVRMASLARRGFLKGAVSQSQFLLQPLLVELVDEVINNTARMGAVAPKRLLKRAVLRNRAKRIMRETARQHVLMAEPIDFIVFLREKVPLKNKKGRLQFRADVQTVLDRTLEQVSKLKKRAKTD
jgi:ribonuclease P protein component